MSSERKLPQIKSRNRLQGLMGSPVGELLARGWLESPVLYLLEHWFFPLSRLWAAARSSDNDVDRFFAAVPMPVIESLRSETEELLDLFTSKRQQVLQTEREWRDVLFSGKDTDAGRLRELERLRLSHRNEYNSTRRRFWRLRKYVQTSVRDCFITPDELDELYPQDTGNDAELFAPPAAMPAVEASHRISRPYGVDYWLRFQSPSARLGDTVYARVLEPEGVSNPPTLIFGHGIGVEFDHWRSLVDVVKFFPQLGIRVIRPEAPWHGRRVPDGFYGGEYFLSSTPLSSFDFFTAQHKEWAVLIDWARQTSTGPLAIGGSSLGAQCAQMTAIRANEWPRALQPDALFLMTHCAKLWEVALDGTLADIWNLHEPLRKLGWNRRLTERRMRCIDPEGEPCVPAQRIVSVIGRHDDVTPYRSGRRLQELWELPPENRFAWPCGHFGVPMRMVRQQQPLIRMKEIFDELAEV